MELQFTLKAFADLTPAEIYAILRLRSEVFVVEQNCVFLDMDDKDQPAQHLMGWNGGDLCAYTRLLPAGIPYTQPSIGRVVTSAAARRHGLGRQLMTESIRQVYLLYGTQPIKIGAQLYLKRFYESFGFEQAGEIYDEDGIDHIHMLLA